MMMRACVNVSGHLMGELIITGSSGTQRLDEGALTLAKAGDRHYRPATQDGRPIPG
jgi:hypothetical protein